MCVCACVLARAVDGKKKRIPLISYVAAGGDNYRKPSVAMWDMLVDHMYTHKCAVDTKESFYCGDAAVTLRKTHARPAKRRKGKKRKWAGAFVALVLLSVWKEERKEGENRHLLFFLSFCFFVAPGLLAGKWFRAAWRVVARRRTIRRATVRLRIT